MNLKYTGQADAPVTFQGKYQVETGAILEDVPDDEANLLLQSGRFEVFEGKIKSSDTKDDDGGSGSGSGSGSASGKKAGSDSSDDASANASKDDSSKDSKK